VPVAGHFEGGDEEGNTSEKRMLVGEKSHDLSPDKNEE